jgi:2-polyprenyl-3-methyl-5-hydroxy-6-metoxy-1,4-benzoquinol methylase
MVSKESFYLLRCPDCCVVYTLDPPQEEDMKPYDKLNLKLKLGDSPNGLTGKLYYHIRNLMLKRKEKIVKTQTYRTTGSLLNYGAKTGFFSHLMEKHGWKVTSIEKYHEERQFSMEMFQHRMIDVPMLYSLQPGTFDVITMWHVFEHTHHPDELLNKFYELLRPGGVLIMACPNINSTDAIHYGPFWAAYDVPRHRWHFNPSSLTTLAQNHGFTLMHHERMPFDSFYISVLSERNLRHRMAFLRGMIEGLYSWFVSLSNRGKSSSIVYAFRKR